MDKNIINLQLFADGGAAGGDGGAAAAAAGETGVQAPDAGVRNRKRRENPLANVQYGIQRTEQAESSQQAAEQGEDTGSFDSLIKGKYKAEFDAHVQNIIRQRFKQNADNEAELEGLRSLRDAVGKKFNVDANDIEGLTKAVNYDEAALEEEAISRGMSVENLKLIKELEEKNEQMTKREQKSIAEQRMQEHFNQLAQQADKAKALYPGFNLMQEMQNPEFARLTAPGVGIDVQRAYELVHMDEIKAQAAQQQAKAFANSIKANGARPTENGLNSEQAAATVKTDPRQLTPADRAEIKRRALRGEKVAF